MPLLRPRPERGRRKGTPLSFSSPPKRSTRVVPVPREEVRPIITELFPEGVCTFCQKITLDALLKTYDGCDEDDLCWIGYDRDRPTKCPLCGMIFDSIDNGNKLVGNVLLGLVVDDKKPERDIHSGRRIRQVRVRKCYGRNAEFTRGGGFRVYAELDSYASNFVPGRRAPLSNFSDATFRKIARWIQDCDETHATCRSHQSQYSKAVTRYLPTRVVHVGSATRQPHLHISQIQQSNPYIALSHCWGRIPQVKTLTANIEQFKEAIIFDRLSKTFQDAICVARRLGIEYIWIDSLCIVQDDQNDWLQESERMGSVYANAYVTIAATSAVDGSGGLDSIRPMSNWIKFPCDGTDEGKGYMWFTDASWTSQTDLDEAPLNTRGWVFQEKILPRRIIHFASSQVYWECKQRFVGEESEDRIHYTGETLEPSQFWADVNAISHVGPPPIERTNNARDSTHPISQFDEFCEGWNTLMRYYCCRNLTKTSDRLIALLGIIRVIEKETGLHCIDGHWDDGSWCFVRDLMWFPGGPRTMSFLCDDNRSRLCSSWSWASLEGPIEHYDHAIASWGNYDLKDCNLHLIAIKDEVKVPWRCHPLEISGMLRTVYKGEYGGSEYLGSEYPNQYRKGRRAFTLKGEVFMSPVGWRCFDRDDEEPEQFYFCPVYRSAFRIACLALLERHVPGTSERYLERVGAGFIEVMVRPDGSECGNMELFETCEESVFYII